MSQSFNRGPFLGLDNTVFNNVEYDPKKQVWFASSKEGLITIDKNTDNKWVARSPVPFSRPKNQSNKSLQGANISGVPKYIPSFVSDHKTRIAPSGLIAFSLDSDSIISTDLKLGFLQMQTWSLITHTLSQDIQYGMQLQDGTFIGRSLKLCSSSKIDFYFELQSKTLTIIQGNNIEKLYLPSDIQSFNEIKLEGTFAIKSSAPGQKFTFLPNSYNNFQVGDASRTNSQSINQGIMFGVLKPKEGLEQAIINKLEELENSPISVKNLGPDNLILFHLDYKKTVSLFQEQKLFDLFTDQNIGEITQIDNLEAQEDLTNVFLDPSAVKKIIEGSLILKNFDVEAVRNHLLNYYLNHQKSEDEDIKKLKIQIENINKNEQLNQTPSKKLCLENDIDLPFDHSTSSIYLESSDSLLVFEGSSIRKLSREGGDFPLSILQLESTITSEQSQISLLFQRKELIALLNSEVYQSILLDSSQIDTSLKVKEFTKKCVMMLEKSNEYKEVEVQFSIESSLSIFERIIEESLVILSSENNNTIENEVQAGFNQELKERPASDSLFGTIFESEDEENSLSETEKIKNSPSKKSKQEIGGTIVKALLPLKPRSHPLQIISLSKTSFILSLSQKCIEQLLAKSSHLGLTTSNSMRLYSAYGRLQTFIGNKELKSELSQLSDLGYLNLNPQSTLLHHFGNPTCGIENLSSAWNEETVPFKILKNNQLLQDSQLSIGINFTLNNLPPVHFSSPIQRIFSVLKTKKVGIVLENGHFLLIDTSFAMCRLIDTDLRIPAVLVKREKSLSEKLTIDQGVNISFYETYLSEIEKARDNLDPTNDGDISEDNDTEEEGAQKVEADESKLDYLYRMGFPVDLAKKALIQCKNTSIDAAIDLIGTFQQESDFDQNSLAINVSLIKPQWNCSGCTLLNQSDPTQMGEPVCIICCTPAPLTAYYTQEDLKSMEGDKKKILEAEKKAQEQKILEDQEDKTQDIIEETLSQVKNGEITSVTSVQLEKSNFLDRFFVGAAFNEKGSSVLRVRRLGYSDSYIESLIIPGDQNGQYNLALGGYPLNAPTAEEEITRELRMNQQTDKVDNLIPVNLSFKNILVPRFEIDHVFENTTISDIQFQTILRQNDQGSEEIIELTILATQLNIETSIHKQVIISAELVPKTKLSYVDPSFSLNIISQIEISDESNSFSFVSNSKTLIYNNQKILKITKKSFPLSIEEISTYHTLENTSESIIRIKQIGDVLVIKDNKTKEVSQIRMKENINISADVLEEVNLNQDDEESGNKSNNELSCSQISDYLMRRHNIRFESSSSSTLIPISSEEYSSSLKYREIYSMFGENGDIQLTPETEVSCGLISVKYFFEKKNVDQSSNQEIDSQEQKEIVSKKEHSLSAIGESAQKLIPLKVTSTSFEGKNKVMNFGSVLFDQKQLFITKKRYSNQPLIIVLENLHGLRMKISDIEVSSRNKIKTDKLPSLFIFTTDNVGSVNSFLTESEYLRKADSYPTWLQEKQESLSKWHESEPVAFGEVSEGPSNISLKHIRSARYLVLIISGNEQCDILQYINAKGTIEDNSNKKVNSDYVTPACTGGTDTLVSHQLNINGDNLIPSQKIKLNTSKREFMDTYSYNFEFFEQSSNIQLQITENSENQLQFVQIELFDRSFGGNNKLREVMNDKNKLIEVVKNKTAILYDQKSTSKEKLDVLDICILLIENYDVSVCEQVSDFLDIVGLIRNLVLAITEPSLLSAANSLFDKLNRNPDFLKRVSEALNQLLSTLESELSTPFGLESFFKFFEFYLSKATEGYFSDNLGQLILRSANKMAKLDLSIGRGLYDAGIRFNPYDTYSILNLLKQNALKANHSTNAFLKNDELTFSSSGIMNGSKIEFAVDLRGLCKINQLLISCPTKLRKFSPKSFIDVEVLSLTDDFEPKFLARKRFDESTVTYLRADIRDSSMNFINEDYLGCLGIAFNGQEAGRLLITISFQSQFREHAIKIQNIKMRPFLLGNRIQSLERSANFPPEFSKCDFSSEEEMIKGVANLQFSDKLELCKSTETTTDKEKQNENTKTLEEIEELKKVLSELLESSKNQDDASLRKESQTNAMQVSNSIMTLLVNQSSSIKSSQPGEQSIVFWEILLLNVGNLLEKKKVNLTYRFDKHHIETLFSRILLESTNLKLKSSVSLLIEADLQNSDLKELKSKFFHLVRYLSAPENVELTVDRQGIQKLTTIAQKLDKITIPLMVKYVLKHVFRGFEESSEDCTYQLNLILTVIKVFAASTRTAPGKEVIDGETVTSLFNVSLWILEQTNLMQIDDQRHLFSESIDILSQLLKRNTELLKSYKFEKVYIETLLARSLKLEAFEDLQKLFYFVQTIQKPTSSFDNQKIVLEVLCQVLGDFFSYIKRDPASNEEIATSTISKILGDSSPSIATSLEFMTFLCKLINKISMEVDKREAVNQNKKKKVQKGSSKKEVVRVDKSKMTYQEATVQRSLSLSSQKPTQEEGIIPASLVQGILSMISDSFLSETGVTGLLLEASKFVLSKNMQQSNLEQLMKLLFNLSEDQKSLLINPIISTMVAQFKYFKLKKNKPEESRDFNSKLVISFLNLIQSSPNGLHSFDSQFMKMTSTWFELVVLGSLSMCPMHLMPESNSSITVAAMRQLLSVASQELVRHANFGASEGFNTLEKKHIKYITLIRTIFVILTKTRFEESKTLIVSQVFSNIENNTDQVNLSIQNLIEWTVLNSSTTVTNDSPAQKILGFLTTYVEELLQLAAENNEVGKMMIKNILEVVKKVDNHILNKISEDKACFVSGTHLRNVFKCLHKVVNYTLKDEHMANFFVLECQGFEFILDHLSFKPTSQTPKVAESKKKSILSKFGAGKQAPALELNSDQVLDPSAGFFASIQSTSSKPLLQQAIVNASGDPQKKIVLPWTKGAIFKEEFGTNLTLMPGINEKGEKVKDWQKFKKGSCRYLITHRMANNTHHEVSLCFQFPNKIEFSSFKVGFLSQWQEYGDTITAEPSYVHLQYKQGSSWKYLCELERYNDNGYNLSSVAIYQRNFLKIRQSACKEGILEAIDSVNYPKAIKVFKLVVGRPYVSFQENVSILKTKNFNKISLALSFISIQGADCKKFSLRQINTHCRESTLMQIFKSIFSLNLSAIDNLANIPSFTEKVKSVFYQIIKNHSDLMTPALISLSKNNLKLGEWILTRLMKPEFSSKYVKLVGEIVLSNPTQQRTRLKLLFNYILQLFKLFLSKQTDDIALFNFLGIFSACLLKRSESLIVPENPALAILEVDQDTLLIFVRTMEAYPDIQQIKKFVVTFLSIPQNIFTLSLDGCTSKLIDILLKKVQAGAIELSDILSIIALMDSGLSKKVFQSEVPQLVSTLLASGVELKMRHALRFVSNFMNYSDYFVSFVKQNLHTDLLSSVKAMFMNSGSDLKEEQRQIVAMAMNVLKVVASKDSQCAQVFASKLLDQCKENQELGSNLSAFFTECFLPLINSMEMVKVALTQKTTTPGNELENVKCGIVKVKDTTEEEKIERIESKLLLPEHVDVLYENAAKILDHSMAEKFTSEKWEMAFKTSFDKEDFTQSVKDKLMGKGPFMILIDGVASEQKALLGIFCAREMPKIKEGQSEVFINNDDNHFMFFYEKAEKKGTYHYMTNSGPEKFIKFADKGSNEKSLVISESNLEKIFLSSAEGPGSHIDLYPMKCLKTDPNPKFEFPYDFHVANGFEVWTLGSSSTLQESKHQPNNFNINQLKESNEFINLTYSFFRESLVYNIPSTIPLSKLRDFLLVTDKATKEDIQNIPELLNADGSPMIDLDRPISQVFEELKGEEGENEVLELTYSGDYSQKAAKSITFSAFKELCNPKMEVLSKFNELRGIDLILERCLKLVSSSDEWKDKKNASHWKNVITELIFFCKLPGFNENFIVRRHSLEIVMTIFASIKKDAKWWGKQDQVLFTNIYKTIGNIFLLDRSSSLRDGLVENGIIEKLLLRLQMISKEITRKWIEDKPKEDKEAIDSKKKDPSKIEEEDLGKKRLGKRTGVGYDNGGTKSTWQPQDYIKLKDEKNKRIGILIEIISNILDSSDWTPPKDLLQIMSKSCVLPLVENAFRMSSLVEMAKEGELYNQYFNLVLKISLLDSLVPALMKLDARYKPSQIESIHSLFSKLNKAATLFKKIGSSGKNADDSAREAFELADTITSQFEKVDERVIASPAYSLQLQAEAMNYKQLPLNEAYRLLLKDQRFGYVSMKNAEGVYKHHWNANFKEQGDSDPKKMVRLAQEIADLSASLPIDSTNAMFVRADEDRLDVMKAIIFGADGTPYAHGAFEYDIFCVQNYPEGPPKVNLQTTGNQDVRFNPNLYANGKVCLSLLGTWRGSASENWDPKLSNLNQVLMSIQSVVMSEEVYFNEPGYEHEAGTEAGEAKNLAYSNIVRLCNMKFAMRSMIESPPAGFEDIIKTHFFLKKDAILKDIKKWRKIAESGEASYKQLVMDHNYKYCDKYQKNADDYLKDFDEEMNKMEEILNGLEEPAIERLLSRKKAATGKKRKQQTIDIKKDLIDFSDIDMTYDDAEVAQKLRNMSVDDGDVKDRWSRYIGVMGMEAVRKQAKASVLVSGLDSLGVEVAKNVILSGVKRLSLHDQQKATSADLSGQFFLTPQDVKAGKNRALATKNKIQELNYYVRVDTVKLDSALPTEEEEANTFYEDYNVVVLVDKTQEEICAASKALRGKEDRKLIVADCRGVFFRVFCDFGKSHIVIDKNGEHPQEVLVSKMEPVIIKEEKRLLVTLLEGSKSTLEDGNTVSVNRVEGMLLKKEEDSEEEQPESEAKGINSGLFKVKTLKVNQFYLIGDFTQYTPYIRGGTIKQVKLPRKVEFKPFHEIYGSTKAVDSQALFEEKLLWSDFVKMGHPRITHIAFLALDQFTQKKEGSLPKLYNIEDAKYLLELATGICNSEKFKDFVDLKEQETQDLFTKLITMFSMTLRGVFAPLNAYLGGVVAQEVIKSITGKFMPIKQTFYGDCFEVLSQEAFDPELKVLELPQEEYSSALEKLTVPIELSETDRYSGLRAILGTTVLEKIRFCNLFMVGSGAIGCELLKNYAMLGIGTGREGEKSGSITLTDPDIIEVSNLNRQFLFREKHLRKPKSLTAASAAVNMNPELKGNIFARLDKICQETDNIYTDLFFEELSVVTNALDNVHARRYIDARCVAARTPLIESGTLGPKGHVQVVIPHKTESYGTMEDPAEENEIPHCTLKMFPEETLHCVEWARDKFGKLFTQKPRALKKCLELIESGEGVSPADMKALKDAVNMAGKFPHDFTECVEYARKKFQKYFHNDIKQLLYVYPLDHTDKDGNPFWRLPKRPPTHQDYNPEDELHGQFVIAFAVLRAKIFGIPIPKDLKSEDMINEISTLGAAFQLPEFVPSDEKAQMIEKENTKKEDMQGADEEQEQEEQPEEEEEEVAIDNNDFQALISQLKKYSENMKAEMICPEEFEKDDDTNYHINAIHSMANLRSRNYTLDPMDWMTVKIKAGRIIPALATTTAAVSGLQTLELVKILKDCKIEHMKNAFMNLAVPAVTMMEPREVPTLELIEGLKVTIWDRWEFKDCLDKTLKEIFESIESEYKLHPKDVIQGAKPIYLQSVGGSEVFSEKLGQLFGASTGEHEDLTITCTKEKGKGDVVQGVPTVRLFF